MCARKLSVVVSILVFSSSMTIFSQTCEIQKNSDEQCTLATIAQLSEPSCDDFEFDFSFDSLESERTSQVERDATVRDVVFDEDTSSEFLQKIRAIKNITKFIAQDCWDQTVAEKLGSNQPQQLTLSNKVRIAPAFILRLVREFGTLTHAQCVALWELAKFRRLGDHRGALSCSERAQVAATLTGMGLRGAASATRSLCGAVRDTAVSAAKSVGSCICPHE